VDQFTKLLITRLRTPLALMPPWPAHLLDGQQLGAASHPLYRMAVVQLKHIWGHTRRRMRFMWSWGEICSFADPAHLPDVIG
jgi:hypothetical protein